MKLLKIFFFLVITNDVAAQSPPCYVYTVIGDASILTRGKSTQLKQGAVIFDTDTILLKKSAALTLLDRSNKFIVINQPGKYTYPDLQKSLDVRSTGITEKYFHFIWEDLLKPVAKRNVVSSDIIGGAVGGADRESCPSFLMGPANGSKIADDTILFRWHRVPGVTRYQLALDDSVQGEFMNIIVSDTVISLLQRNLLKGEKTLYHWRVTTARRSTDACSYNFTAVSESAKDAEIQMLANKVLRTEDEILYYLQLSDILAQHGWYNEAAGYLNNAKAALEGKRF